MAHLPYISSKRMSNSGTRSSLQYLRNTFVNPVKVDTESSRSECHPKTASLTGLSHPGTLYQKSCAHISSMMLYHFRKPSVLQHPPHSHHNWQFWTVSLCSITKNDINLHLPSLSQFIFHKTMLKKLSNTTVPEFLF